MKKIQVKIDGKWRKVHLITGEKLFRNNFDEIQDTRLVDDKTEQECEHKYTIKMECRCGDYYYPRKGSKPPKQECLHKNLDKHTCYDCGEHIVKPPKQEEEDVTEASIFKPEVWSEANPDLFKPTPIEPLIANSKISRKINEIIDLINKQ